MKSPHSPTGRWPGAAGRAGPFDGVGRAIERSDEVAGALAQGFVRRGGEEALSFACEQAVDGEESGSEPALPRTSPRVVPAARTTEELFHRCSEHLQVVKLPEQVLEPFHPAGQRAEAMQLSER